MGRRSTRTQSTVKDSGFGVLAFGAPIQFQLLDPTARFRMMRIGLSMRGPTSTVRQIPQHDALPIDDAPSHSVYSGLFIGALLPAMESTPAERVVPVIAGPAERPVEDTPGI